MDQVLRDRQKESWKEELQEIERKRTELLLEHQKMQKRSQKLQSLQDKKKHLKDDGDCEEEMRTLHEERQARFQARFHTLCEKSGNCRNEADILGKESRRGKKR